MGAYELAENGEPESNMGRFIICPHCVSVWFSFIPIFSVTSLTLVEKLYTWLGIAGATSLLFALRED